MVAPGLHLEIAGEDAHGALDHGAVASSLERDHEDQDHGGEGDRGEGEDGAPRVAPEVAPGQPQAEQRARERLMARIAVPTHHSRSHWLRGLRRLAWVKSEAGRSAPNFARRYVRSVQCPASSTFSMRIAVT